MKGREREIESKSEREGSGNREEGRKRQGITCIPWRTRSSSSSTLVVSPSPARDKVSLPFVEEYPESELRVSTINIKYEREARCFADRKLHQNISR